MDDYLKSLQQEKAKVKEEQSKALQEREEELRRLQSLLQEQERRNQEQAKKREQERAEAERTMARAKEEMARARDDMAREMDRMKKQLDEERQKMRAAVDADRKNREAEADKARANDRRAMEAAKADMEKALHDRTKRMADLERSAHEMEQQRNAARQKAEAAAQEATKLHRALADAKATPPAAKADDRGALLEKLSAERRELAKLREQVMADMKAAQAHAAAGNQKGQDLQAENERLRNRVQRLENALRDQTRKAEEAKKAPPANAPMRIAHMVPPATLATPVAPVAPAAPPAGAGTIVINNEEGEIHIHIHGGAPSITTTGKPPAGMPKDLQLLPPVEVKSESRAMEVAPLRLRLQGQPDGTPVRTVRTREVEVAPPAKAEKSEPTPKKKGEGKKINDEDRAEIEEFLLALFGVS
jgi:hypothetical protein